MSTTTDTTTTDTTGAAHAVAAYAGAVRHHLSDLQPETLDELTGGLEADLNDSLADRLPQAELDRLTLTDLARRFGDPGDYAAEMRDAAGIAPPASVPTGRRTLGQVLSEAARGVGERWSAFVARHRVLTAITPVVRDLRPAWWLVRGWLLYQILQLLVAQNWALLPQNAVAWLVFLAVTLTSIQWGRGAFGQGRGARTIGHLVSALSLIAALPIASNYLAFAENPNRSNTVASYDAGFADGLNAAPPPTPTDGVYFDGTRADNLFVYGPDGQPIEGAQIVDQDGNPLILQPEGGDWRTWDNDGVGIPGSGVPLAALEGDAPLNAFPYRTLSPAELIPEQDGGWTWDSEAVREPQWPAPSLFPLPETHGGPEEPADADTAQSEESEETGSDESSADDSATEESAPEDASPEEND
ncbi:hypothetical protein [Ruania rhizosphaerae]|uniref:hypothetical protein n=1 Tax=Ruania rhizosphaerae TaxID=1840413 RepID=UPI001356F71C|nr:hypothetical protein [Ruania rhizosphaerae]